MVLKLYYHTISQPSRAIWILLKVNKIPFEEVSVNIMTEEHKKGEIIKKNPNAAVPFIEDTDTGMILTESVAILTYITAKYKLDDHWYPAKPEARSRVDEYLSWQHFNTRGKLVKVFLNESFMKGTYDKVETVNDMNNMLNRLESYFLKDQKFLTGCQISLADLLAVCELEQMVGVQRDILKDNQNDKLIAWKERVKKELSPHFEIAHKFMYDLPEMLKQMGK